MNHENENRPNLTIFDPESGVSYNLLLNDEEVVRASTDEQFLSSLLFHAKATNSRKPAPSAPVEQAAGTSENNKTEEPTTKINQPVIWQYNEVVDLIKSMATHVDDLNHPRKRKQVFENVANDLISLKYQVSAVMVQNKWNSLVKSYRKAKDNKSRTGRSPSRFNFYELMDEILGANPTNSCSHAINSNQFDTTMEDIPESPCSATTSNQSVSSEAQENNEETTKTKKISEKSLKREYIDLKREEGKKRQKRHEDFLALEHEKIALENRKLDLLEKYLNTKCN